MEAADELEGSFSRQRCTKLEGEAGKFEAVFRQRRKVVHRGGSSLASPNSPEFSLHS